MNAASADTAENVANIIEAIATVIALAGLAVSFYFSWKGQVAQKQQAEAAAAAAAESNREAQAAAQRAAAASALTIDELTRIADGVQAMAREAREGRAAAAGGAGVAGRVLAPAPEGSTAHAFEAPTAVGRAAWSLSHDGGDHYRLANTGTAIAHDVWVGGAETLEGPDDFDDGAWIAPGSSVSFTARVRPTTTDSTITVTWAEGRAEGERSSWRYPLPAPPLS
ncbi:hypothetical protein [Frondihabitans australicus]|uniref:Uncharacterized protein n=1 Tax=Frondihabitans australicus TaxID=386892 RepID=A0A495IFB0_9MICO|nr:hypothetical protein [Frondihabitans australicus]RKR74340.1 hypothetical protein C8E83_1451 [Frondihabitans australicus]